MKKRVAKQVECKPKMVGIEALVEDTCSLSSFRTQDSRVSTDAEVLLASVNVLFA